MHSDFFLGYYYNKQAEELERTVFVKRNVVLKKKHKQYILNIIRNGTKSCTNSNIS